MIAHADINMPPKGRKQKMTRSSVKEDPDSGVSGQSPTINDSPPTDQNLPRNTSPKRCEKKKRRGHASRRTDSGVGASQLSRTGDDLSDDIQRQLYQEWCKERVVAELEGIISTLQELKTTLINQP